MPTTVNITIDAPAANLTLREPENFTLVGAVAPDTLIDCTVGHYANQGNVTQRLTFEGLADVSNCTFDHYRWTLPDGSQVLDGSIELAVDTQALLEVWVRTEALPVGSPEATASFTVDVSHDMV